jgi:hypothetical protein
MQNLKTQSLEVSDPNFRPHHALYPLFDIIQRMKSDSLHIQIRPHIAYVLKLFHSKEVYSVSILLSHRHLKAVHAKFSIAPDLLMRAVACRYTNTGGEMTLGEDGTGGSPGRKGSNAEHSRLI